MRVDERLLNWPDIVENLNLHNAGVFETGVNGHHLLIYTT